MPVRDPDVQVTVAGDGARVVHLSGAWDIRALQSRAAALQSALRDAGPAQVSLWDLTQIQRFDHIGAMLVWRTWGRCRPSRLQLKRAHEIFFGACVFIVNILGIGIVRELGPVVCSILVAGRSGSAITAQLGVMRVTEELDALSVMGISNTLRLILPKMAAIAVALPLLVLWTSGVALVGGAVSAKAELGMSVFQFFTALPAAVPEVNLWLGVAKGVVFGVLIALIACHFGLRIQPNTESLAAGTTRSVVTSITAVIVADAILAVIFSDVGWS